MSEEHNSAIKVAFLGPYGTYSHQAALQAFEGQENVEFIAQPSIGDCFTALQSNTVTYSIVPFENSSNGSVIFTYDLLRDWFHPGPGDSAARGSPDFRVVSEEFVSIHHCLLIEPRDEFADLSLEQILSRITTVYSHPQVWGQCTKFLHSTLKTAARIDVSSTSRAAGLISEKQALEEDGGIVAAIASKAAAAVHGSRLLVSGIEDVKTNTTRFLKFARARETENSGESGATIAEYVNRVLSRIPTIPTGNDVTFVTFSVRPNDPGSLCDALKVFKDFGRNLTSIMSRPTKIRNWEYVFFVEFQGHLLEEYTASGESESSGSIGKGLLTNLFVSCPDVKIIGCFPRSPAYWNTS